VLAFLRGCWKHCSAIQCALELDYQLNRNKDGSLRPRIGITETAANCVAATTEKKFHGLNATDVLKEYCIVGWVDIGTAARVPLRFSVYLSKTGKIRRKISVYCKGEIFFLHNLTIWVSKDEEFYDGFMAQGPCNKRGVV
jgi:hypothetical protein